MAIRRLTLAILVSMSMMASESAASPRELAVKVLSDTGDRIVIEYQVDGYRLAPVAIDGRKYVEVTLGRESRLLDAGAPALPKVSRSLLVPGDARMESRVLEADFIDLERTDVAPSKGNLLRSVDPATVPYRLGPAYRQTASYPGPLVSLGAPYLLRNRRGVVVDLFPFQYDPAGHRLRIYRRVVVEVVKVGAGRVNTLVQPRPRPSRAFDDLDRRHFLNYPRPGTVVAAATRGEEGSLLIICHDPWLANVQPLVEHKNAIGIPTTAVGVGTIGNNAAAIKSYLQTAFASGNLAFVLLVGDAAQVATASAGGAASDPSYAKLAGSDDYPDIFIGRFSAESAAQVDTQVARTIGYENPTAPATQQGWFKKAVGIGSTEGPGDDNESDYQHIDNIRTDLLGYGYTEVDQVYDPSASAGQLSGALDAGRGFVNYCGHGYIDGWGTTGFSSSNVNALTNDHKLPFIVSVACNVGEFNSGTCFAESWLRAQNGSAPTGAIGFYGASISQAWNPPMCAQDAVTDILLTEENFSLGALLFAGASRMMDEYGGSGVTEFDAWHLFGDPSLRIFGVATPPSGLWVDPGDDLAALGNAGGPFTPEAQSYTLENRGEFAIDYTITADQPWIAIDPASGSLPPASTTSVTVSLAAAAATLGNGLYQAEVSFVNATDHDGDSSRSVTLEVGLPSLQHEWPLDTDPGWVTEGQWEFGAPAGAGGEHGSRDPASGHTGTQVYGYNLAGDYQNGMSESHLTTTAIDCSYLSKVRLEFWRWLGVETGEYDHAYVRVSTDGQNWTTVWENPSRELADDTWVLQEIDLSAIADGAATLYLRWTMGSTDQGWAYCGWNVDDIEIWGLGSPGCWDADGDGFADAGCGGDDCDDGDYDIRPNAVEACADGDDNDCDGATDADDADCGGDGGDDDDPDPDDPGADDTWVVTGSCAIGGSASPGRLAPLVFVLLLGLGWCRRRSKTRLDRRGRSGNSD